MSCSTALAAGEGTAGFRDGSFTSAYFNRPLGLAVSPDDTRLFVADSLNNRIRVVHLDQDNNVTTLAGQGEPGKQDGSLSSARFNQPHGVAYLPGDRLAVNDFGNKLLRLADLKQGTVSTLGGNSPTTLAEGPATQISMAGILGMVYLAAADSIFLTQPGQGTLKRLDLKTGQVTLVPTGTGLPHPAALCADADKLYVADQDLTQVFALEWKDGTLSAPSSIGAASGNVLALAKNGSYLYAIQLSGKAPLQRLLPENQPVSFMTVWGDEIPPLWTCLSFMKDSFGESIGFIPDPLDERKFYISKTQNNLINTFRDTSLDPWLFPRKPPHTFRILVLGDSRLGWAVDYLWETTFNKPRGPFPNELLIPGRLELELNTLAALEDVPWNFEVLTMYHSGSVPLCLWPTYEVPVGAQKYDADLVLIFQPNTPNEFAYKYYFTNPITPEGIPTLSIDAEYLLKPPSQRIPDGEPRRFYDLCKSKKLVRIDGNNFVFDQKLFLEPDLHDSLVQLYGKPIDLLNRKLSILKTSSGQPVRLLLCSTHTGLQRQNLEDPKIYADLAQRFHVPFLDLNEEVTATRLSYFPLNEIGNNDHLNPSGHFFFSFLLAHSLIREGFIPWGGASPDGKNTATPATAQPGK